MRQTADRWNPWSSWPWLLLWTGWLALYAILLQSTASIHHDMAEAFAWGQQWPLGTYKHPPLMAWMAGAWFSVLPRADWAFYLLSAVNAAAGLAGAAQLAKALAADAAPRATTSASPVAELALPLAMATPTFSVLALTFNANTVLLALWPWTVWAFVRSLGQQSSVSGAVFGLLGGLALLGKYTSLLMLASCLVAALLHPGRRRYFASPAPYAAVAVALLVTAPHALWSISHGFPALVYAQANSIRPWSVTLAQALGTTAGIAGIAAVPLLALRLVAGPLRFHRLPPWILVLALGPALAVLALGFVARLGISTNFLIPALYGVPALLLAAQPVAVSQAGRPVLTRLRWLVAGAALLLLVLAPVIAITQFRSGRDAAVEPRRELAQAVTVLWREATGAPLRISAGSAAYGVSLPFYSPDRPADFTGLDPLKAPWVTEAELRRSGLLVACLAGDAACMAPVKARPGAEAAIVRRLTLSRRVLGWDGPAFTFDITMFPPARALAGVAQ